MSGLNLSNSRTEVIGQGYNVIDLSETSQGSQGSSTGPSSPGPKVRGSMALPVKVLPLTGVKVKPEVVEEQEEMEPEDLSLPHRKRKLSADTREEEEPVFKVFKQESQPSESVAPPARTIESGSGTLEGENYIESEDEDDDDDDDEDDDDKDYGQVEEPTLVNPCFSSPEADGESSNHPVPSGIETLPQAASTSVTDLSIEKGRSDKKNVALSDGATDLSVWQEPKEEKQSPHFSGVSQQPVPTVLGLSGTPTAVGVRNGPGRPRKRLNPSAAIKPETHLALSGKFQAVSASGVNQLHTSPGDSQSKAVAGSSPAVSGCFIKSGVAGSGQAPQAFLNPEGRVWGLHVPIKLADKRERDENWKKYLIR